MKVIRAKRYKTNIHNPTGLARCDYCGFSVNGAKLQKYMVYAGAPAPDYSVAQKFTGSGDPMGSGEIRWNGMMVCSKCHDIPNPSSKYLAPKADPYIADGNRPMPSNTDLTLVPGTLLLETNGQALLETGGDIFLE